MLARMVETMTNGVEDNEADGIFIEIVAEVVPAAVAYVIGNSLVYSLKSVKFCVRLHLPIK